MVPDVSYKLYLLPTARSRLLGALQAMCSPDDGPTFEQVLHTPTITSFDFDLMLPPEPSIQQWAGQYAGPQHCNANGLVRVSRFTAWLHITPLTNTAAIETQDYLCLKVWPPTRSLQIACVQAPSFWNCLVSLLETCDGRWGFIDDATGGPFLPFWSHTIGQVDLSLPLIL